MDLTHVEIAGARAGEQALRLELETPQPGEAASGYAFLVSGTLTLPPGGPGVRWLSAVGAGRLTRGTAHPDGSQPGRHRFAFVVGTAALPREFDLELFVLLDDGTRAKLARITGRRAPLESRFEPTIQPLLVTTLGRSGSSLLAGALGAHPEILAYRPFGREPRAVVYWVDVFRELSDPASATRQLAPGQAPDMSERGWWLARGVPQEPFDDEPALDWMGTDHVVSLAGYCQGRVESLYRRLDAEAGTSSRYFAEKARPEGITATVRELYPSAKELILVRDWRDMFCSMRAYSTQRGTQLFGREMHAGDDEHLGFLRQGIDSLVEHWEAAEPGRSHLVRYEDLVLDPAATMEAVLDHLELDRDPAAIARMCALVDDSGPAGEAHRTTASAAESIGRWRRELAGDLLERTMSELGAGLDRLGYEPG